MMREMIAVSVVLCRFWYVVRRSDLLRIRKDAKVIQIHCLVKS